MKYIIGVIGLILFVVWYFYKANYPIVIGQVTDTEIRRIPSKVQGQEWKYHVEMKVEIHHFYKIFNFDIHKKRPAEMSFRGIGKDFTEIGVGDIVEFKITEDIKTASQLKILRRHKISR